MLLPLPRSRPLPPPGALRRLLSDPPAGPSDVARTHALVVSSGHSSNPFFAAKLISLYASLGLPNLADAVFFGAISSHRTDAFLWNSIIKAHFSNGEFPLALRLFRQMRAAGARPNHFTVPMVASACAEMEEFAPGACVHGFSVKFGLLERGSAGVGASLVHMYSKGCGIDEALCLFAEMPERDVISWTSIIIGCARNDKCELALAFLGDMHRNGEKPNSRTVEGGLQACGILGSLAEGMCLQAFAMRSGLWGCDFLKSSMLSVYSKCDSLEDASVAFRELRVKDVVSWTEILGHYSRKGLLVQAIALFESMLASGVYPDGISISCLLMAFTNFGDVSAGMAFHAVILRRNFIYNSLVVNTLLAVYCKFEKLHTARVLFDMTKERDIETWNSMLHGYGRMGLHVECLNLFREVQFLGITSVIHLDNILMAISSCSLLGHSLLGKSVHCFVLKHKVDAETSILNSLVCMYGKVMKLDYSRRIFDQMRKDVITWNSLISSYAHAGCSDDALSLFCEMISGNIRPNATTLVVALSACSSAASLHMGEWIHNYINENQIECGSSISTALVDMYAKCGQLMVARNVFDSMKEKDIVAWNAMISAYGNHGCAEEALQMFIELEEAGVAPNGITFLSALSACSHAGFVEEGKYLFDRMIKHSVTPTCKHYACMVDLLGRSGRLKEAEAMILTMPSTPDGGVWGALLGACKIHNNLEVGERAGRKALELDPDNDGYYTLLSNLYSSAGKREDAEKLREAMSSKRLKKRVGWSMLELDGLFHVFIVEDKSHPQFEDMHWLLESFLKHMEEWYYATCERETFETGE